VDHLNDYGYLQDPSKTDDSRWVGRPAYPADRYASRKNSATNAGEIFIRLNHLIEVRRQAHESAGGQLTPFLTNPHILGYQRSGLLDSEESPSLCTRLRRYGPRHQFAISK
jgi:amylosucrase